MKEALKQFWADAEGSDKVVAIYATVVFFLILIRAPALPDWSMWAGLHAAVVLSVFLTVRYCTGAEKGLKHIWRYWDAYPYCGLLFFMTTKIVHPINPNDWDYTLIAIDRAIGGLALLQWTMTWTNRVIDEIMKVAWVSYYFLPFIPGLALFFRKDKAAYREAKSILVLGFVVSYVGYFLFPALGPLHHKAELGLTNPSTGIAVAGHLKKVVTAAVGTEGRYMLPSGHTLASALVIVVLIRNRAGHKNMRWIVPLAVPYCLLIISSTMIMRYHYVIDVVTALALVPPVVWAGIHLFRDAEKKNRSPGAAVVAANVEEGARA